MSNMNVILAALETKFCQAKGGLPPSVPEIPYRLPPGHQFSYESDGISDKLDVESVVYTASVAPASLPHTALANVRGVVVINEVQEFKSPYESSYTSKFSSDSVKKYDTLSIEPKTPGKPEEVEVVAVVNICDSEDDDSDSMYPVISAEIIK